MARKFVIASNNVHKIQEFKRILLPLDIDVISAKEAGVDFSHVEENGSDFEEKYTLADLLCELDARHSCERIRLGSMAPELLGESFISKVAGLKILVPHFHVSMQSGSDGVLMAIRALMGDVMITADLMVGFPGESDADFADTMRFVSEARLLDAHVFAYSRREGTPAAEYSSQIPENIKRERSAALIKEVARVRDGVLSEVVSAGKPLMTVFEEKSDDGFKGHSDSYIEVKCKSADITRGELLAVRPIYHKDGVIYGEIIGK